MVRQRVKSPQKREYLQLHRKRTIRTKKKHEGSELKDIHLMVKEASRAQEKKGVLDVKVSLRKLVQIRP